MSNTQSAVLPHRTAKLRTPHARCELARERFNFVVGHISGKSSRNCSQTAGIVTSEGGADRIGVVLGICRFWKAGGTWAEEVEHNDDMIKYENIL